MPLPYVKQTWNNGVAGGTPISAARLQYMEDGLADLDAGKQAVIPPGTYAGSKGGIPTTAVPTTETQGGTLLAPTPTTVFSFQPRDPAKGPFNFVIGGATFGGFFDAVSYFGYNVADGGGRAVATEPRFSFNIEQDYWDGTKHTLEAYFEWNIDNSVTGYAGAAKQWRPIFWQFNRATGLYSFQLKGAITFSLPDDSANYATIGSDGLRLMGEPTQTTDTALVVSAQNGKKTFIQLEAPVGGGCLLQNSGSGLWEIRINNADMLTMTSGSASRWGDQNQTFKGVASLRVTTPRKDDLDTLYVSAQTGQTTKLLAIKNAAETAFLFYVMADGRIRHVLGSAAAPAISVEDAGGDTGIFSPQLGAWSVAISGAEAMRLSAPADTETALMLRRNVGGTMTLQRVSMGAADSGGAGFKALRVPN